MDIQAKFDSIKEDNYFRFLMENAIDVIWYYDLLKNGVTYISPSVKHLTGYTQEEMLALSVKELLTKDSYQKLQELVREQAIKLYEREVNDTHMLPLEFEVVRKDGSSVWCEYRARLVLNEKKRPIGMVGITRDTTERKAFEERLKRKPTKLEREVRRRTKQLNEANNALKVLLIKKNEELLELEENIHNNIRELISPLLDQMKSSRLTNAQLACLDNLESNLMNIVSPFVKRLSSQLSKLSPTEIQVANLVKQGKQSKEIAHILTLSLKTIEFHRDKIREKLGIKNKKVNLRSYLLTLE
jgi:PAS domain S-box-containing protein